jgi:cytochrome c biogenesis protein ResB
MKSDVEKAELFQSITAYLIPTSLFVATVISAAGMFLVYSGYMLGWFFLAITAVIFVSAFVTFINFQNRLRAQGKFRQDPDELKSVQSE